MRQSLTGSFFFDAPGVADTGTFGSTFASCATAPLVLWLAGDLGSGKTTFSRSFIRALGYGGRVVSPTYTLLEIYETSTFRVLHFDFYRLGGMQDFEELGARGYLDGRSICLIEWPENIEIGRPPADLRLDFDFVGRGRQIRVCAESDAGAVLLAAVRACLADQS